MRIPGPASLARLFVALVLCSGLYATPVRAEEGAWTPEDAKILNAGQEALRLGRAQEALRILEPLRRTHPNSGVLHRVLGHAQAEAGRTEEARVTLIRALSLGQMTEDVLGRLVQIDHAAGRPDAVLASVRLLLLLDPDDARWLRTYADLLFAAGELPVARVVYGALLDRHGADGEVYDRLGRIAHEDGRDSDAVLHWESAYWTSPSFSPELAERIAALWARLGDEDRSMEWSRLSTRPDRDQAARMRHAELLFTLGDFAGARGIAEELQDADDRSLGDRALLLLGHCAHRTNDLDAALRWWGKCLERGSLKSDLLVFAGRLCADSERHAEAVRFLGAAVEAPGDPAQARALLIHSLLELGERARARAELVVYLERNGLDPQAESLLRRFSRTSSDG